MTLRPKPDLERLVTHSPALTLARRQFFVDLLLDLDQAGIVHLFDAWADSMPDDEYTFLTSCFDSLGEDQRLPDLPPISPPLLP